MSGVFQKGGDRTKEAQTFIAKTDLRYNDQNVKKKQ